MILMANNTPYLRAIEHHCSPSSPGEGGGGGGDGPWYPEIFRPQLETQEAVPNGTSLKDLIQALESSKDKGVTVGLWSMQHEGGKAKLTPADVAQVLQHIRFFFEQPPVARELATGIDELTCAHVVAALEVCPFQKPEVALAMTPYVVDGQSHGHLILDQVQPCDRHGIVALLAQDDSEK
jgi:hypothetical protein